MKNTKCVQIRSRRYGTEARRNCYQRQRSESFNLYEDAPDYDALVDKIFEADQTICWW